MPRNASLNYESCTEVEHSHTDKTKTELGEI